MNFLQRIPGTFVYPFKGDGWISLIAGGVFFFLPDLLARFSFIGIFVSVFLAGYYCAFMLSFAIHTLVSECFPILGYLILSFTSLYFTAVEMRIMGVLYACNREDLQWV